MRSEGPEHRALPWGGVCLTSGGQAARLADHPTGGACLVRTAKRPSLAVFRTSLRPVRSGPRCKPCGGSRVERITTGAFLAGLPPTAGERVRTNRVAHAPPYIHGPRCQRSKVHPASNGKRGTTGQNRRGAKDCQGQRETVIPPPPPAPRPTWRGERGRHLPTRGGASQGLALRPPSPVWGAGGCRALHPWGDRAAVQGAMRL